jgi:hypothetical protein
VALESGAEDWDSLHQRIDALDLPQRPDARVAARYAAEIAGHEANVVLLGVTRELAALGDKLTVVDWSREQIDQLWSSQPPSREAILADWRAMELPRRFTAAVGDGSLSTLAWPDDYARALGRVADGLLPGGRLVVRCYLAPDTPEALEDVVRDVESGREPSFHATRWRVAMAVAGSRGNVTVADIYDAFEEAFPDREALSGRTGWSMATIGLIDAFRGSPLVYSFITRQALLKTLSSTFTGARFTSSGEYPLSERCPLLVAERAG